MRQSVTQEFDYGCSIACFAFALGITCQQAEARLGKAQFTSNRFWAKDLQNALHSNGLAYSRNYVTARIHPRIDEEGAIVLIRRSSVYPAGCYLIRHQGAWMDLWINLPTNRDILQATPGFRTELPGQAMYALLPQIAPDDT